MKKKKSLLQKFDALLRKVRVPRWLHHMGPKTYTSIQHCKAWLLKEKLKCSWDDFFDDHLSYYGIYDQMPEVSTLKKFVKRLPFWLKNMLIALSAGLESAEYGAMDSTGLSRTSASRYYLHRIDRNEPIKRCLKLSMYTTKKRILAFRLRAKWRGDTKDVPYLIRNASVLAETNCLDKGYDANWVHEEFRSRGLWSIISVRKNAHRGCYRKEMRDYFDYAQYWQRNCAEYNNSALKRRYGSTVKSRTYRSQHSEVAARIILHNLKSLLARLFHWSLGKPLIYKLFYFSY